MRVIRFIKKLRFGEEGSTIIELFIYSTLFVTLILVMTSAFGSAFDVRLHSEAASYVQQDIRYIFQRLEYDVHRADNIVLPTTYGNSGEILELGASGDTLRYYVNGGVMYLERNGVATRVNGNGTQIASVSFLRGGSSVEDETITIDLTIESVTLTNGKRATQTLKTTIGRR